MDDISKKYYAEELQTLPKMNEDESLELYRKIIHAAEGGFSNPVLTESLIEGNLYRVYNAVSILQNDAIPASDLIQEGNLALVMAVGSLTDDFKPESSIGAYFDRRIIQAMTEFAEQEADSARASEELKARLNVIDRLCTEIAEKEGREATVEELAETLQMDPSDVEYLMRIALSALEKEE